MKRYVLVFEAEADLALALDTFLENVLDNIVISIPTTPLADDQLAILQTLLRGTLPLALRTPLPNADLGRLTPSSPGGPVPSGTFTQEDPDMPENRNNAVAEVA